MSDLHELQGRLRKAVASTKDIYRGLPPEASQEVKTAVEILEAELRHIHEDIGLTRLAIRHLIDG